MSEMYRPSKYIDFNTGRVILDPEMFIQRSQHPMSLDQKIDFFECRVDVWQLGVAVEILKQIEAASGDSLWCHGAYALLSSYFEMVGNVLNPDSARKNGLQFGGGAGLDLHLSPVRQYHRHELCAWLHGHSAVENAPENRCEASRSAPFHVSISPFGRLGDWLTFHWTGY